MRVIPAAGAALARRAALLANQSAETAARASWSLVQSRCLSDKGDKGDKGGKGRGKGAANLFIQKAQQRVFDDRVKLSKVAAIMASRKAAQKMKPKVAAPVEGQFESAEESEQKRSRRRVKHAKHASVIRRDSVIEEHAHRTKREPRGEFPGGAGRSIAGADGEDAGSARGGDGGMSQMFDDMDIKARSGEYEIDVSGLGTGGDQFLAELFNETSKTKDGEVLEYYVDEHALATAANKIQKPRTAMQLLYALQPNVRTAQEGTRAHQFASTAHQLLMRSPYYSNAERQQMVDSVGRLLSAEVPEWVSDIKDEVVLQKGFRPGLRGASQLTQQQKPAIADWYGDQAAPSAGEGGAAYADEDAFDEDELERLASKTKKDGED